MLTLLLGDSATEAAWWGAVGQWAGAFATVAAVIAALVLPARANKRTTAERRAQLAAEVMAAVLDLQTALMVVRTRAYGSLEKWTLLLGIGNELFAEGWPSKKHMGKALLQARDINQGANDFAFSAVSGPMARCYAALVQVSLSGSDELHKAAQELRVAVSALLTDFANKRKWDRSIRALDKSMANFRTVTVKVTGAAKY